MNQPNHIAAAYLAMPAVFQHEHPRPDHDDHAAIADWLNAMHAGAETAVKSYITRATRALAVGSIDCAHRMLDKTAPYRDLMVQLDQLAARR